MHSVSFSNSYQPEFVHQLQRESLHHFGAEPVALRVAGANGNNFLELGDALLFSAGPQECLSRSPEIIVEAVAVDSHSK